MVYITMYVQYILASYIYIASAGIILYSNIYNIKLHTGLILGVSLYIIITTLIYPTPLLLIINESIVSTLI